MGITEAISQTEMEGVVATQSQAGPALPNPPGLKPVELTDDEKVVIAWFMKNGRDQLFPGRTVMDGVKTDKSGWGYINLKLRDKGVLVKEGERAKAKWRIDNSFDFDIQDPDAELARGLPERKPQKKRQQREVVVAEPTPEIDVEVHVEQPLMTIRVFSDGVRMSHQDMAQLLTSFGAANG